MLTLKDRFPLLNEDCDAMLRRIAQHPHAPRFNYPCGERLDQAGLQNVREYAQRQKSQRAGWTEGQIPDWLAEFVKTCRRDVPYYRDQVNWSDNFFELPTVAREDLRREPWSFVPDDADISQLIVYRTSGTTGNLLQMIAHPVAPNRYLPLMETVLSAYGVAIEGGRDKISIIQVASQRSTYTLYSAMSYFNFAGFAKINLNSDDWNSPDDRVKFIDDAAPEIYTGDPFSFAELAKLPLKTRPKAMISSATSMLPGEVAALEAHFGCPVIDMYALNEAGPVAFSIEDAHEILPHNLYVEVLDETGRRVPPGATGEIVVSGGVNPNLPLIRYQTGDYAAIDYSHSIPRLVNFQGRKPVVYRTPDGGRVNSIEVSVALFNIALPFFSLHQHDDSKLTFKTRTDAGTEQEVEEALRELFGVEANFEIQQLTLEESWNGKWIQYTSDLSTELEIP